MTGWRKLWAWSYFNCLPTGMASFRLREQANSGPYIPINQYELSNLSYIKRNNFYKQYSDVKVVFIEKISMVGCHIFSKIDLCLQEIFGCKKVFGGCHVVAIGDLYNETS